jgi:hypothetical protein
MKRGKFLCFLRANILMNKMEKSIDEIVQIKQKLIEDLNEFSTNYSIRNSTYIQIKINI